MKVAVFGLGYVGAVTAAGLAARGHRVVGVDVDTHKVDLIAHGQSPVVEPGIDDLMREGVASGRLSASQDARVALDGADVSLLCVGTPSTSRGATDLTFISRAVRDIRDAMTVVSPPRTGHHSVVVRSTVPPGTGRDVVAPVFSDKLPAGWSVGTAMCPEFLREGAGVADFFDPPFVVVGTTDAETHRSLDELFAFLEIPLHHVTVETAEALKYACNAFHATKVAFANEIARVFRPYGVDSREVMRIFCEDTKLNISPTYLRPGFAFGGSCLPKDLRSLQHLARTSGVEAPLLVGTTTSNEISVREVVDRVVAADGRRVALLGLSFKSDTDDLRESPNVELAERLVGKGFDVRIYDPIINPERLIGTNRAHIMARLPHLDRLLTNSPEEALDEADVALVTSTGTEVVEALQHNSPGLLIDLSGRLGSDVEDVPGYQGVGW
ncbi:UDP-glucose dehydrogenase family protein [Flexivirga oryzae]|uniref:UDP-glucose 6-dehydrogenase n=1 Tax=Flexivirga oryzae TaxID=1794944 RepID=A0A839N4J8_9MICO|nr:nucleotide sugar dehydrogenase [Flexivirga oryzae]MBB2890145.1 GDP-mannose 6-dehydrogenase [Flexivirga oryzae]